MNQTCTNPQNKLISSEQAIFRLSETQRSALENFLSNKVFSPEYAARLEGHENARKIIDIIRGIMEGDTLKIYDLPAFMVIDIAELLSPELQENESYFSKYQTREEFIEAIKNIPYIPGSKHKDMKIPHVHASHRLLETVRAYFRGRDRGLKHVDLLQIAQHVTARYGLRDTMERLGDTSILRKIGNKVLGIMQFKDAANQ